MIPGIGLFKRFEDIRPEDIMWIKENQTTERQDLEFKEQDYGKSDSQRIERLRDIASMANGGGGYLIIGIKEEDHRTKEIVGVDIPVTVADSLMSSCLSGIQPRLIGLDSKMIKVEDKEVVIIFIPPSGDNLFSVTYDDKVEFWKRYNDEKRRMTSEEIRQTFLYSTNRFDKSMTFLSNSIEIFIGAPTTHPKMLLATVPYGAEHERVDPLKVSIKEILLRSPIIKQEGGYITPIIEVEPMLRGARIQNSVTGHSIVVHRNGYVAVEFPLPFVPPSDSKLIYGGWVVELLKNALYSVGEIYRDSGITVPILVEVALKGLGGTSFVFQKPAVPRTFLIPPLLEELSVDTPEQTFSIDPIEIPPGMPPESVGGKIAHRIWQAFHQEKCPWVDEKGEIIVAKG